MMLTRGVRGAVAPGSQRNGLGEWHDYTYRGKLPLEVELPYECAGGCGRRLEKPRKETKGLCTVCRGVRGIGSTGRSAAQLARRTRERQEAAG